MSQKNKNSILFFKCSIAISVLFLSLLTYVVFSASDQIQNQKNAPLESTLLKSIEKIEITLQQLDQIPKNKSRETSKNLILQYNELSNQFNSLSKSILESSELKNKIELKNKVITANNQAVEFVEAIKTLVSNSKNTLTTESTLNLKTYSALKNDLMTSSDLYNQPTVLFFISSIGFILFSIYKRNPEGLTWICIL